MDYVKVKLFVTPNGGLTDATVKFDTYIGDMGIRDWTLVGGDESSAQADVALDVKGSLDSDFLDNDV